MYWTNLAWNGRNRSFILKSETGNPKLIKVGVWRQCVTNSWKRRTTSVFHSYTLFLTCYNELVAHKQSCTSSHFACFFQMIFPMFTSASGSAWLRPHIPVCLGWEEEEEEGGRKNNTENLSSDRSRSRTRGWSPDPTLGNPAPATGVSSLRSVKTCWKENLSCRWVSAPAEVSWGEVDVSSDHTVGA